VPVELSVTVWLEEAPIFTVPKLTLEALSESVDVDALRPIERCFDTPAAVAVIVAVCAVLTVATATVKLALVAPEATVTEDGMTSELLSLVRETAWPLLPAAPFRVTVQVTEPVPTTVLLPQLNSLGAPDVLSV
jgi:hypothetical protein